MEHLSNFEMISSDGGLYFRDGKHYRLFSKGKTLNACWLVAPILKELKNIDTFFDVDVYEQEIIELDGGTVPSCRGFINYR